MTSLTAYLTSTNDGLVTTARQIASAAPASETSVTNKIAKSTGWGMLRSQGNTGNWAAGGAEPSPDGTGFIWNVTTLELQRLLAGTYTPSFKMAASNAVSGTVYCRVYKRSSGGVYTLIAKYSKALSAFSTAAVLTSWTEAQAGSNSDFVTGDKLYIDFPLNITVATSSVSATFSLYENGGSNESLATPGYSPSPSTISPSAIASSLALGTISVGKKNTVTVSAITSTQGIGAPTLAKLYHLNLSAIASSLLLSSPSFIKGAVTRSPSGISSNLHLGSPSVVPKSTRAMAPIQSGISVGSPAVSARKTIAPNGIGSSGSLGTTSISKHITVSVNAISRVTGIGAPQVKSTAHVQQSSIQSSSSIGSPYVGLWVAQAQSQNIAVVGFGSGARFGYLVVAVGEPPIYNVRTGAYPRLAARRVSLQPRQRNIPPRRR